MGTSCLALPSGPWYRAAAFEFRVDFGAFPPLLSPMDLRLEAAWARPPGAPDGSGFGHHLEKLGFWAAMAALGSPPVSGARRTPPTPTNTFVPILVGGCPLWWLQGPHQGSRPAKVVLGKAKVVVGGLALGKGGWGQGDLPHGAWSRCQARSPSGRLACHGWVLPPLPLGPRATCRPMKPANSCTLGIHAPPKQDHLGPCAWVPRPKP